MKNKRTAVAGISVLGAIGVISTGFAGWVITAPPQSDFGEGTITADGDVKTKGYVEIKSATMTDSEIRYAASSGTNPTYSWLASDNKKADLYAKLVVTLSLGEKVTQLDFTNVALTETSDGEYSAAATNGIVGTLPVLKSEAEKANSTTGYVLASTSISGAKLSYPTTDGTALTINNFITPTSDITVMFEIYFAWGSVFEGKNPFDFYNNQEWSSELQGKAEANIKKLGELNDATFKFSFTVAGSETSAQA